jgi:hypothetical protein
MDKSSKPPKSLVARNGRTAGNLALQQPIASIFDELSNLLTESPFVQIDAQVDPAKVFTWQAKA